MEESRSIGTIVCNGGVILEVYDEEVNQLEENDSTSQDNPGESECVYDAQDLRDGIIIDEETGNQYVTAQDENGQTVLCLVNIIEKDDDQTNEEQTALNEPLTLTAEIEGVDETQQIVCLPSFVGKSKPYKCEPCNRSFTRKSDHRRHKKIHGIENMRGSSCPICESGFGATKLNGTASKRPFVCGICDKGYITVRELKKHFAAHVKENIHICESCDERFETIALLKKHSFIHNTEKPHFCTLCDKSFRLKSNMKSHMRVHCSERPFICEYCNKGFKSACERKSHLLIHTDEKPYGCQICGKHFRQSGNLNSHLRIHRQERPYVCPVCGKAFVESGKLKRHGRIHTLEKPYLCPICGKGFCDSSNRKSHMKVHAKENPNQIYVMYVDEEQPEVQFADPEDDDDDDDDGVDLPEVILEEQPTNSLEGDSTEFNERDNSELIESDSELNKEQNSSALVIHNVVSMAQDDENN